MLHEMNGDDFRLWHQLHDQTKLLEQDINQASGGELLFDYIGIESDRTGWYMQSSVRNTVALFRQELLTLTRLRFPWATSVELKLSLDKEEPYQVVYIFLSPLPPLP